MWELEMSKLPKTELIKMIRKIQTGTEDRKLCAIETSKEAHNAVEGIINDYEGGIIDKQEVMVLLGEYTSRLMGLFWENAKKVIKNDISILDK